MFRSERLDLFVLEEPRGKGRPIYDDEANVRQPTDSMQVSEY
jgi:hypothetical protein